MLQPKTAGAWDFFGYALYAFGGLGLEVLLICAVEPFLFGTGSAAEYTSAQNMIHWGMTILCWGALTVWLVRGARKKLSFDPLQTAKPDGKDIALSGLLGAACVALNAWDWGGLKLLGELGSKPPLLFCMQYLYYFFEVALVLLIVVFGQKFAEALLRRESRFPWGGVVLCCTWGAVHILTKGSVATGAGVMVFSLAYGEIFLLLRRNAVWSYGMLAAAFIL